MPPLVVRSQRVVLPDGVRAASIAIEDGRIAAIAAYGDRHGGADELDAAGAVVLPGLVDTHVHVNDPGRADWEGFDHATRAAAAGGVTTIVDMPLNSIPATTTPAGLEAKRDAARGRSYVDVGFWGGVVPGNRRALEPLGDAGVLGFKCFLSPSGVEEFGHVSEAALCDALPLLASMGLPLLVHAELPELLEWPDPDADPRKHRTWAETRPPIAESAAIHLLLRLSSQFDAPVHIVHLAAADALPLLRRARAAGTHVTVETCPHYLTFADDEVPDGATPFKCAPPLRTRANRELLWRALVEGDIDMIASDHSPAPPALKSIGEGDFLAAWGGIASLQLGPAAVWTGLAARSGSFTDLARWLAAAPAALAGLDDRKGTIAVGQDADLVIWDPDDEFVVVPERLYHRHPLTPYAGRTLRGRVRKTLLRGTVVFDGEIVGEPRGEVL
ncbi:MAG TPA: allantoinase AllB [Vicinamibacterales bacterium]|nr:allantoinase AllB [Vicinamibacterales bacterium]